MITDTPVKDTTYYFNKDGTITADDDSNAYKCLATPKKPSECDTSVGCKSPSNHEKDAEITIVYTDSSKEWTFKVEKTTP